jgi:arsenate reductase
MKAIEFTRTNEKEFKEVNLSKDSSDEDILKVMAIYPKLMQRAIVFDENKAILCRPPENVLDILKK